MLIELFARLQIDVIAEGIENNTQYQWLKSHDVHKGLGYYTWATSYSGSFLMPCREYGLKQIDPPDQQMQPVMRSHRAPKQKPVTLF